MRLDISPVRAFPAGALALLLTLGSAPGCLSPASAEALVSTGFATPQQTVASFQTYLRADLPQREFRCFSMGFRERNGLSALSYGEAREELFRNQPWLKLVAGAKVAAQRSGGEGVHWMDLETVGRTVRVKLAREDIYEILAGEELLTDGEVNFESAARLSERSGKSSLNVRPISGSTSFR